MRSPRLLGALLAILLAAPPASAGPAPEGELAQNIRARLDAYREGQAARWASFVDDDCFCAGEKKADIRRAIENRPPAVKNGYGELLDLEVHTYGEVAIVRYRVQEFVEVNGKLDTLEQWRTETHLRRAGAWVLVAAAENAIVPDPQPVALAREVLSRYAGKYEYTPGSIDAITLEGDQLFVQSTGEPKVAIFAETENVFFAKGQPWRLVFGMGPQGKAIQVTFRQSGQEYAAKRLD